MKVTLILVVAAVVCFVLAALGVHASLRLEDWGLAALAASFLA